MILQAAPLPRRPLPSRAQLLDPKYLLAPREGMMMRRMRRRRRIFELVLSFLLASSMLCC